VIWRFSDGTTAELGGKIEGASLFAQELRAQLDEGGDQIGIMVYGGPGGGFWLDRNDVALFDAWLEQERTRPYRRSLNLRFIERPADIPPLPPDPRDLRGLPEDAVF
jgi:hypothetical protein